MIRVILAAMLLVVLPASAAARPPIDRSPDLWATVNVCDTERHPNAIGIRGSMPGLGRRRARLLMRFQVHYLAKADGKWHNVLENGDSGYQRVGTAKKRVLESGWTFRFKPPPEGGAHTLRGAVTFVWKRRGRTVKRLREVTLGGHRSTKGADPPGFSAAVCQIS